MIGRPRTGLGHYLRDIVYGALDGVITTLAVVAGASGARLESRIGLILGLANLVGDGLSMGASNYLGLKSELLQTGRSTQIEKPWRHGLATAIAFAVFGAVPLLAYLAPRPGITILQVAVTMGIAALAILGVLRARYVGKPSLHSALEVIVTGLLAGGAAFVVGAAAERVTR